MCLYSWVDPGCWFKAPNAPDRGSWLMGLRSVLPQAGLPTRQVRKKIKVDTSKFMTPYLAHSQKMLDQFSHVGNIWFVVLFSFDSRGRDYYIALFFPSEQVPSRLWQVQRETSCLYCWYPWNDPDQEGPGAAQWGTAQDNTAPFFLLSSNITHININ